MQAYNLEMSATVETHMVSTDNSMKANVQRNVEETQLEIVVVHLSTAYMN